MAASTIYFDCLDPLPVLRRRSFAKFNYSTQSEPIKAGTPPGAPDPLYQTDFEENEGRMMGRG